MNALMGGKTVQLSNVEADRIRKVPPPELDGEALNPDFGAQADSEKVFDQELDVHGNITVIDFIFPLGHDTPLMDADAQFRFHHSRKSGKDKFNT